MGKRILGDDPFASPGDKSGKPEQPASKATGAPTGKAQGKGQGGKQKGKGKAARDQRPSRTPSEPTADEPTADEPPAAEPPAAATSTIEPAPIDAAQLAAEPSNPEDSAEELASLPTVDAGSVTADAIPEPAQTIPQPSSAEPHSPSVISEAAAEYGPSIDRPWHRSAPIHQDDDDTVGADDGEGRGGLASRVAGAVRHFEEMARDKLGRPPGHGELGPQSPPLEFLWSRWRKLAMRDRSDVVDEFGRDPGVADEFAPVLDFFYRTWFRVEARGLEHIPASGRGLIVGNHSGTLPYDGAMLMYGVRAQHPGHREVRPLVEDFVFHFPYLGTLMNRIGGVRACQENAERLLRQDQLVAVFPEGIKGIGKLYSQRYQLQRFGRGGFIKLALSTDAPIIPVAIVGAEEIHPLLTKVTWLSKATHIPYLPVTPTFPWLGPLGLLPFPTRWTIAFGEPLYFNAEYGAEAANDRILVGKLAEQVRQKIQEMIDALLRERRSVFFG